MLPMLGDAHRSRLVGHDRVSERSFLFTMSNIAPSACCGCAWMFSANEALAGGARRNRTDDLLLAKQALSQLSYGPSRCQGSEASLREHARRCRHLMPESGRPGKF